MEHKQSLEEANKATLEKLEAYLKTKATANAEQQEKLDTAKDKWQSAWNEFLEALLVLERLEI